MCWQAEDGIRGSVAFFFFQAEDSIRDPLWSRGFGDVYKRQPLVAPTSCHTAATTGSGALMSAFPLYTPDAADE